ncbi:hypothetical protein Tsp_11082 [Trichinella spiralis]|uniref:hypothetical protein n=1 Tax=Trichinella spiralis TaxID=6334 RepID=UPI0001EFBB93|nr:hypothetical protein Tsp_11082 [Trichinella spiralis]
MKSTSTIPWLGSVLVSLVMFFSCGWFSFETFFAISMLWTIGFRVAVSGSDGGLVNLQNRAMFGVFGLLTLFSCAWNRGILGSSLSAAICSNGDAVIEVVMLASLCCNGCAVLGIVMLTVTAGLAVVLVGIVVVVISLMRFGVVSCTVGETLISPPETRDIIRTLLDICRVLCDCTCCICDWITVEAKLGVNVAGKIESNLLFDKSSNCKLGMAAKANGSKFLMLLWAREICLRNGTPVKTWVPIPRGLGERVRGDVAYGVAFQIELEQVFETLESAGRDFGNAVVAEVGNFEKLELLEHVRLQYGQLVVVEEQIAQVGYVVEAVPVDAFDLVVRQAHHQQADHVHQLEFFDSFDVVVLQMQSEQGGFDRLESRAGDFANLIAGQVQFDQAAQVVQSRRVDVADVVALQIQNLQSLQIGQRVGRDFGQLVVSHAQRHQRLFQADERVLVQRSNAIVVQNQTADFHVSKSARSNLQMGRGIKFFFLIFIHIWSLVPKRVSCTYFDDVGIFDGQFSNDDRFSFQFFNNVRRFWTFAADNRAVEVGEACARVVLFEHVRTKSVGQLQNLTN